MTPNESPESVVNAFILSMNAWELWAWQIQQASQQSDNPSSYWKDVTERVEGIFSTYCTIRPRPLGRQATFQHPPEYDPERETILSIESDNARAMVYTHRNAIIGAGTYKYLLLKKNDKWRIDNVKIKAGDKWLRAIL